MFRHFQVAGPAGGAVNSLTPRITPVGSATGAAAGVALHGHWTAAQLTQPGVWRELNTALQGVRATPPTAWDVRGIERLDHLGALVLWNHWGHQWPTGLAHSPGQRAVLERVARHAVVAPPRQRLCLRQRWLRLGALVLRLGDHGRDLTALVGQLAWDLARLAWAPQRGPWRDVGGHVYKMGATALPITAMVGFLIGVVLAYLTAQQLRQFGAETFIVDILGLSLIRELGPVLTAVLMAGRSGSAITAQLGVMQVTQELDAMRVMGIAPGARLVLPRTLALALVLPLLTVWTTLAALGGGMLAADGALGVPPAYFWSALPQAVQAANLTLALGKAVVFGVLIALLACHFGLRVQPNTQSLGRGTTASVVSSITAVIVVDALFAVLFKDVGI